MGGGQPGPAVFGQQALRGGARCGWCRPGGWTWTPGAAVLASAPRRRCVTCCRIDLEPAPPDDGPARARGRAVAVSGASGQVALDFGTHRLRAISTSTCPCPVSSVQLPAGLLPESHALRTFAPVETREISLACLRAGAVMQVAEDRNRLDVACSGHFRPAAGARGRGSLDGKVANTTGKACRRLRRIRTRPGPGCAVWGMQLAGVTTTSGGGQDLPPRHVVSRSRLLRLRVYPGVLLWAAWRARRGPPRCAAALAVAPGLAGAMR
jgi:hypothetical protein